MPPMASAPQIFSAKSLQDSYSFYRFSLALMVEHCCSVAIDLSFRTFSTDLDAILRYSRHRPCASLCYLTRPNWYVLQV